MGKARSFSDAANDTVYQTGINSENYSMGQQNTYNLGSVHFTDQSGIGNFSQAGSDQRKASLSGALFLGNLGFDLQTVELDVGTFTIDLNNDSAGVVLSVISTDRFVTLSAGTTADLVTITGAQRPGQRLRLYNTTTNTITIKHTAAATVNTIRTPDGTDLTFLGNGVLDFTFDITSTQWRVVGNIGGSGGGTTGTFISAALSANQTANTSVGNHIEFDTNSTPTGANGGIILQTGAGQADGIFELISGKTYFLSGTAYAIFQANDRMELVWYDITNATEIGVRATLSQVAPEDQGIAQIIITPTTDIEVELRIVLLVLQGGPPDFDADLTFASIFELFGGTGTGGVSLPIITLVDVLGNVNTNQDIDLSLTTAHSTTLTLTGDIDITFSSFPATASQIEWEVEVTQDGTGGHVITWPAEVVNPPTLLTTANSISVVVFRTNDGGTTVRVGNTVTTTGTGTGSQTPWLQNIDGAGFILSDAGDISIRNILTDGLEATLTLERNDTTALDGDTIGNIFYDGPTDTGANATWTAINVQSSDVSNAAKQGELTISVQHDNVLAPILNYTGSDATLRVSTGIDVLRPNANGTKELGTASFFWDDVFSETFTMRGSGGNTTGTARTVYADSAGMVFNMPSTAAAFTHSIENEIFSLLTNGELEIRTELSDGPTLRLRNNDQTPVGGSNGPKVFFNANDSVLTEFTYGSIVVNTTSVLAGAKNATMEFRNMASNTLDPFMNFIGALDKINMFKFLDMNSNYIEFDDRTDPGAPAATERRLFSDSGNSAHLTIRTDTTTIDLEAGTSQTPWLQNIDADGFDLTDLSNIEFRTTTGAPAGTVQAIYADAGGIIINVPTSDVIQFKENDVLTHSWSDFVNNIIRISTGALGPVFQLTLDSSSPADDDILGTLVYGGRDSANNLQTYATIEGISADVTSASENGQLKFFVAGGTGALVEAFTLRSIASLPVVGFFGDAGTVKPTITGSRAGNAALADLLTSLDAMGLVTDSTTA